MKRNTSTAAPPICWKFCLSGNNNSPSSRSFRGKIMNLIKFFFSLYFFVLKLACIWVREPNFTAVCFSLKSLIHDLCSLSWCAYFTIRRKNTAFSCNNSRVFSGCVFPPKNFPLRFPLAWRLGRSMMVPKVCCDNRHTLKLTNPHTHTHLCTPPIQRQILMMFI